MAAALLGCGEPPKITTADNNGTTIVCTSPAAYALVSPLTRNYLEDGGDSVLTVQVLGKPGQDMHSYETTCQDMTVLANADVVVCPGAEGWLDAALKASGNTVARVVSMMEACDVYAADHDHSHEHSDGSCALIGNDEHVWLSVEYATRIVLAVTDALKAADSKNAAVWEKHGEEYNAELTALNTEFHDMMKTAAKDTVVVADRHPFVYLFAELGLDCVAAFPGCSAETDASFATQTKLIEAVETNGLSYIFTIEGSDGKIAETVAAETGAQVLTLNSLQVVTDYGSVSYIEIMRGNLENLKKALE
jgi:zinc transport system substrate-binding protein